jgi:hypothetical protein
MPVTGPCHAKKPTALENDLNYVGIGIAMLVWIENTVSVTIRQSDSEPIASEATTASISRDDATGAERPTKPAARGDRVMAEFLRCAGESPATSPYFAGIAGDITAKSPQKWRNRGRGGGYARYFRC